MPEAVIIVELADCLMDRPCEAFLVKVDVSPVETALTLSQLSLAALVTSTKCFFGL